LSDVVCSHLHADGIAVPMIATMAVPESALLLAHTALAEKVRNESGQVLPPCPPAPVQASGFL
jgi:hypothetical protein